MKVLDKTRGNSFRVLRNSISETLWKQNQQKLLQIRKSISDHPVAQHPAISALNNAQFTLDMLKTIHLEYRHAIVQVFTDALLVAGYQSRQLEPLLSSGSKMAARTLLTLNYLDEFGFSIKSNKTYEGNPEKAHYPLFEALLDQYGISQKERFSYQPSPIANRVREFLENSYEDFVLVVALLAVAEQEVVLFSAPLRKNTAQVGIDVSTGYYHVHGTTEDTEANANDDCHEDDLWYILTQSITPERYDEIHTKCLAYCQLWNEFWSLQLSYLTNQPTFVRA